MTKQQTLQILTVLASNYQGLSYQLNDEIKSKILVNVWHECIGKYEYNDILLVTKRFLLESKEQPTIADIVKNVNTFLYVKNIKCGNSELTEGEMEIQRIFGTIEKYKRLGTGDML